MNHEKDEIVAMDEEVSRRELSERFSCFLLWGIRLKLMGFSFRIKMLVWQVKQQQIVVRINIRIKPMMMKKKMNLFISNQVHVHDGKNDVKLFVFLGFVSRWNTHSFFLFLQGCSTWYSRNWCIVHRNGYRRRSGSSLEWSFIFWKEN